MPDITLASVTRRFGRLAAVDDVSMTSGPEHRTVVSLSKRLAWRPGAPFGDSLDDELEDGELADAG